MLFGPTEYFRVFPYRQHQNDTTKHHFSAVISDSCGPNFHLYKHQKKVGIFQLQATKNGASVHFPKVIYRASCFYFLLAHLPSPDLKYVHNIAPTSSRLSPYFAQGHND